MARRLARAIRVTDAGKDYLWGHADGRAEGAAALRKLLEAIDEAWMLGGAYPVSGVARATRVLRTWEAARD